LKGKKSRPKMKYLEIKGGNPESDIDIESQDYRGNITSMWKKLRRRNI